jgi:hypothetical protein
MYTIFRPFAHKTLIFSGSTDEKSPRTVQRKHWRVPSCLKRSYEPFHNLAEPTVFDDCKIEKLTVTLCHSVKSLKWLSRRQRRFKVNVFDPSVKRFIWLPYINKKMVSGIDRFQSERLLPDCVPGRQCSRYVLGWVKTFRMWWASNPSREAGSTSVGLDNKMG